MNFLEAIEEMKKGKICWCDVFKEYIYKIEKNKLKSKRIKESEDSYEENSISKAEQAAKWSVYEEPKKLVKWYLKEDGYAYNDKNLKSSYTNEFVLANHKHDDKGIYFEVEE